MKLKTILTLVSIFLLSCLLVLITIAFLLFKQTSKTNIKEQSDVIVEQINEVNKLITLEGNFAEVYSLDQTQKLFFDLIPIPKKAIVIAKAKTYVAYDLSVMEYQLDQKAKTVMLTNIPEPEIIVDPKLEFYDLKANILPFTKSELSLLNERATDLLREEAKKQGFLDLAEDNLRLNLEKIILVAEQQGWTVIIDEELE